MKYDYTGKKVLVVGMAKSGISAAKLLKKLGAETAIYDRRPAEDFAQNGAVIALLKTGVIDDNVIKAIEETAAMVTKQFI